MTHQHYLHASLPMQIPLGNKNITKIITSFINPYRKFNRLVVNLFFTIVEIIQIVMEC